MQIAPFPDHKLSWMAAILFQHALQRGPMCACVCVCVERGASLAWVASSHIQTVIICNVPDRGPSFSLLLLQAERKQNGYRHKTHRNWFHMQRAIKNIAKRYKAAAVWSVQPARWQRASWGTACYRGQRCEIWSQTERYKRKGLPHRCLKWAVNWWRKSIRDTRGQEEKLRRIVQWWEMIGCL